MKPISIKVASSVRSRMVQELLFSLDWQWKHSGKDYKNYDIQFLNLNNFQNRTFGWAGSSALYPIVSSEEFMNDPYKYITGVVTN